jgi:hypothetical protein
VSWLRQESAGGDASDVARSRLREPGKDAPMRSRTARALALAIRSLPVQCALLAGAFWLYHLWLKDYLERTGLVLGALRPRHLAPLLATPDVHVSLWLVPGTLVVAAFVVFVLRWYLDPRAPAPLLIALSVAAFLVIGLSVAMIDGYRPVPEGWMAPAPLVTYARDSEFYHDVTRVRQLGVAQFLGQFSERAFFKTLALHTRTHPAGPVVFLWYARRLFHHGLLGATLTTVAFSAFAVWPLYSIGRSLYGSATARMALALFLLMPNVVLVSTTSMDGPCATVTILALALFLKATRAPLMWAVAFGLALALASFMTYASVFVPLFALIYSLAAVREDRKRWPQLLSVLAIAAITVVVAYGLLYARTGYSPIEAARAAIRFDHKQMGSRTQSVRLWLNLGVAHLMAFFIGVGVPLSVLWGRRAVRTVRDALRGRQTDLFTLAFVVSIVLLAFSTLFTMEVERIWLFMAPCVAVPAAHILQQLAERDRRAAFYWTMALLGVQTLAFQTTLRTLW